MLMLSMTVGTHHWPAYGRPMIAAVWCEGMCDDDQADALTLLWADAQRRRMPPERQMDCTGPDLWRDLGWGSRLCYWRIDGHWYWRKIDADGDAVAHGEGEP